MRCCTLLLCLLLLFGCGTPMPHRYNVGGKFQEEAVPQDTALVYVYYRQSPVMAPCYIWQDGQKVGVSRSGTYFTLKVVPGSHTYLATNDSSFEAPMTVTVKAGEVAYLEVRQESDFLMAHAFIDRVEPGAALSLLPHTEKIAYTP